MQIFGFLVLHDQSQYCYEPVCKDYNPDLNYLN